jgi:hypothetical protein
MTATDANCDPLTYAIVTSPTHGTLTGTGATRTYTPAANYNGADAFTFKANDGKADSNFATVSITVTAVNDAPVANAQSVTTAEDTAKAITLTGSDVDGDTLTYAITIQPLHGTLSGTGANVTYTPAANYNGADSFSFTVSDGTVTSAGKTVSITVTAVDDPPAVPARELSATEDTALPFTLTATDVDTLFENLTFAIATQPAHGTVTGSGTSWTYTPAANYTGAATFTYTASDGTSTSAPGTVSVYVNAVNDAPVANAQSVTTAEDTAKAITLTGSDVEGSPLTYAVVTQPTHGSLTGTGASLTYTPAANFNGADSFTFTVNDGMATSGAATVMITVTPVNDAPVANPLTLTTPQDTARPLTLTGSDVEGDALTFAVVTPPAHGTLTGTGANLTYTPAAGYSGADAFTFKANDGLADSAPATVSFTVTATTPPAPATGVTLTASLPSPQVPGTAVTFTAAGQGSSGYQYQFYLRLGTGAWTIVQSWSAQASWTMPTTTPIGAHTVVAWVKTDPSKTTADAIASTAFTIGFPRATGVTLTSDLTSPQPVGTAVTFTAAGQGSSGYMYQFFLRLGSGAWNVVQPWSTQSTWRMPTTTAFGTYTVVAWVKTDPSGTVADSIAGMPFIVGAPPANGVTLTASLTSPQPAGTAVTFTGAGQGSFGYFYQFYLRLGTGPWNLVQSWSTQATWTMPADTPVGSYTIAVWAKTNPNTTVAEAINSRTFTVCPPPATGLTVTASLPSPQPAGTAVTFTGAGQGSSGYSYQFYQRLGAGAWNLVQSWSTQATWTMPANTPAGSYTIVVWVKTDPAKTTADVITSTAFTIAP